MGFGSKIRINNTDHSIASSLYGTCVDSAGTVGKLVTCADFDTLMTGVTIHVKFTYGNTAANPTLNVNGTGAKPIYSNGTTAPGNTKLKSWYDNTIVSFTYDGAAWCMNDVGAGISSAVSDLLSLMYPVGSLYMSVNSTNPGTLFGGTWEQITGKFLVAGGSDGFTPGTPGGQKTITYTPAGTVGNTTLTTSQIPSHTHTFTGTSATTSSNGGSHTHTGPSHSHGLNSHTHSIPALSGTAASAGSHAHPLWYESNTGPAALLRAWGAKWGSPGVAAQSTGGLGTDSDGAHTHSVTTVANTTGGSTASTAAAGTGATGSTSIAHTHTLTATGSNANTGGGGAHNHGFTGTAATLTTLPPYLPVYVWKRTA